MRDLSWSGNCLHLLGVYETEHSINLVLEFIKGGELIKRLQKKDKYGVQDARQLMKNILLALQDVHSVNIIHRDLKPENILMYDQNDQTSIKIADFGLATYDSSIVQQLLFKKCGTPGFIAPEVFNDNVNQNKFYDNKVDIFSAGVIFYILFTGEQPFKAVNNKQLIERNKACQIDFQILTSNNKIPKEAQNLIQLMLKKDPNQRLSVQECLNHPFIRDYQELLNCSLSIGAFQKQQLSKENTSTNGLNCLKIQSNIVSKNSSNELYWIQPMFRGQTTTMNTVTYFSQFQIQQQQQQEVVTRPKNKSQFAKPTNDACQQENQIENEQEIIGKPRQKSISVDVKFNSGGKRESIAQSLKQPINNSQIIQQQKQEEKGEVEKQNNSIKIQRSSIRSNSPKNKNKKLQNSQFQQNQGNIIPQRQLGENNLEKQSRRSESSYIEADYRVSEIEENINHIFHNQIIRRSLEFRYNPFLNRIYIQQI